MLARPALLLLMLSATATIPTVRTFGTVKSLVETRADAPKTTLASVLARPHAYAVGSLSHLRGEITILDGVAWLVYPPATSGEPPRVTDQGNGAEQAAFLAAAYVAPPAGSGAPLVTTK